MLSNFFNSFYYGKSGKGDFNPENLPGDRKKLFGDMLRIHLGGLIRLNLLYVVCLLPILAWTVLNYMAMDNMFTLEALGELETVAFTAELQGLFWSWLFWMFPLIAITGPATAGVTYIARNWARDQHVYLWSDFKDAFKANWKQSLIISTITGLVPIIVYVSYQFYGDMVNTNGVLFVIPQVLILIAGGVWFLMLQLMYSLMVTYALSFKNLLRNAFVLAVGRLPQSVGIRLLALAPMILIVALLFLIPSITGYLILFVVIYYLFFGFAFSRFCYASFANAVSERYINPRIAGAEVGIGLRKTTDDDYEIDPTLPQPEDPKI